MDVKRMEAKKLDETGVNGIFDTFDLLKDKITRIEVGGSSFLKAFLQHKCFEQVVSRPGMPPQHSAKNDAGHATLRGTLFGAKVYHKRGLANGTIRVFGQELEPHDPDRSKHSLELVFRT